MVEKDVDRLALPLKIVTGLPNATVPSRKVIVPVVPEDVTVAINVTCCPGDAEVRDAATIVVEAALLTTSVTVWDVLGLSLASPL